MPGICGIGGLLVASNQIADIYTGTVTLILYALYIAAPAGGLTLGVLIQEFIIEANRKYEEIRKQLPGEVNIEIQVPETFIPGSGDYYDNDYIEDFGWMMVLKYVLITNRSHKNKVSLSFEFKVKLVNSSIGRDDWSIRERDSWRGKHIKHSERFLHSPLLIKPQESATGDIVFFVPQVFLGALGGIDSRKAQLEIIDHVSGQRISMKVPGKYHS